MKTIDPVLYKTIVEQATLVIKQQGAAVVAGRMEDVALAIAEAIRRAL